MIFCAPPHGLGQGSSSTCCSTHSLSSEALAASTPLLTAVLGSCPTVPVSLNCWGLLLQLGCTFTNGLSWALFMVPQLNFSVWLLWFWAFKCYWGGTFTNSLSWLLTVPSLCCALWPLRAFKASTVWVTLTLPSLADGMRDNLGYL